MSQSSEKNNSDTINQMIFYARKNYLLIILSFALNITFVFLYAITSLPQYTSSAKIFIEQDNSSIDPFLEISGRRDINLINNQQQILKSRSVAEATVNVLAKSELRDRLYLFQTRNENDDLQNLPKQALRKLLLSEKFAYKNYDEAIKNNPALLNLAANNIKNNLIVISSRTSDIINISYTSNNAFESALVINTVVDVYKAKDLDWKNNEHSYLQEFLDEQLLIKKSELSELENTLKVFQEENKIFGLDDNSESLLNSLQMIESDFYLTVTEIEILNEKEKFYKKSLNKQEQDFSNTLTNTIDTQLMALRNELAVTEAEFLSSKAKNKKLSEMSLKAIEMKIENLKNSIKKETEILVNSELTSSSPIEFRQSIIDTLIQINTSKNGLAAKKNELSKIITVYEDKLKELPQQYLQFSRLQRDKFILDETYSLMKKKYEESRISEASQLGKVKIIDVAIPSNNPTWPPNPSVLSIMALFLCIVNSFIFIFIKEKTDNTIKSFDQIEQLGLTILGIIPKFEKITKTNSINKSSSKRNHQLISKNSKSLVSEAFRTLRTSLSFIPRKGTSGGRSFIVSSSGPSEGKSTTCANLAITYANLGKKTLIIEFDLRKPVMSQIFKIDNSLGITKTFIDKKSSLKDQVQQSDIPNLDVLCSGPVPPNPSEIIGHEELIESVKLLQKDYDIILVDTPPIAPVTDTLQLANIFDDFILVIRANKTQKLVLDRSLKSLKNINKPIQNCIVNEVSTNMSYGGYYYDSYNYYYANEDED